MHQKVAHAPTPNSTPLQESDMRRSDDLAGHNDDTADSGTSAGASPATATSAAAAAAVASPAAQTPGSLKVQVKMGSPPAASPSKVCRIDVSGETYMALVLPVFSNHHAIGIATGCLFPLMPAVGCSCLVFETGANSDAGLDSERFHLNMRSGTGLERGTGG
jgi:hypothetical protein